ncbi:MAG TPA: efflux RND transporter periplasmic adaptor subunit [Ktedonobacterales bacterium]|nr:efflux RND transporter periplasmic adaptor subunit [Ktedonobacterales bacterium]
MAVQPTTRSQPLETFATREQSDEIGEETTSQDAQDDRASSDIAAADATPGAIDMADDDATLDGHTAAPVNAGDVVETEDGSVRSRVTRALAPYRTLTPLNIAIAAVALALVVVILVAIIRAIVPGTPTVTLYTVQNQTLTTYVGGGGLTYPAQSLTISYPVSANVTGVNVEIGQNVKKGQQLLQLSSADLTSQVQQAYSAWQASIQYVNSLYTAGATQSLIAFAQSQETAAKGRYDALTAEINSPTYSNGNIVAPFNGIVSEVDVTPGISTRPGSTLVVLQDATTVIVRAEAPLEQRSQVKLGQTVLISPDATPNQTFYGKVQTINPTLTNAGSDTFEVWVSVANPTLQLLLNESVYVRIQSAQVAPTVPELAVINPDADSIVYVYANGRAHVRHVVVGVRDGDRFGVVSGLQPGDQVILVGQYQLTDNEPVNVRH